MTWSLVTYRAAAGDAVGLREPDGTVRALPQYTGRSLVDLLERWSTTAGELRAIDVADLPRAGDVRDSMADTASAVRELGHAPRGVRRHGRGAIECQYAKVSRQVLDGASLPPTLRSRRPPVGRVVPIERPRVFVLRHRSVLGIEDGN